MNQANNQQEDTHVISYLALRRSLGVLGIALPFILIIGNALIYLFAPTTEHKAEIFKSSISHYYYTGTGSIFVGILFAYAMFLYSYKGYKEEDGKRVDNVATNLAATFALGVALFPTGMCNCCGITAVSGIHFASAALFLITLSYISFFLFTKTGPAPMTLTKQQRNKVYRTCGIVMMLSLILLAIYMLIPDSCEKPIAKLNPVFWLETVALVAFGISWLTKGEYILKDKNGEQK